MNSFDDLVARARGAGITFGDIDSVITRCITRKYPQQFLICIVSDWVLVAVDAGVRLQVTR